jgi:hypothetical protein
MERNSDTKTELIYIALKFGVVLFMGGVLYTIFKDPGFDESFWNGFFQVVTVVAFIAFAVLSFALSRHNFNIFGFFGVVVASIYHIFHILFTNFKYDELPDYLLLIIVSLYFMTKNERRHRHGQIF